MSMLKLLAILASALHQVMRWKHVVHVLVHISLGHKAYTMMIRPVRAYVLEAMRIVAILVS